MKARHHFLLLFLLFQGCFLASAMGQSNNEIVNPNSADPVVQEDRTLLGDDMPTYAGLNKFLMANLRFPKAAQAAKVKGTVFVGFVVLKDGSIVKPKLLKKKIGYGCDEEALRLVKAMPKWKPGKKDGKPADIEVGIPIRFFYLEKE